MTILDRIIATKRQEVAERRQRIPVMELESTIGFSTPCRSLAASLRLPGASGIIAEFKRQSPSKGVINANARPEAVSGSYQTAGASGMSVLTDAGYFGGSRADLEAVRNTVDLPVLRKDFIIDEYQVVETKSMGADVMLLIAACLDQAQCRDLAQLGNSLGLEVLLELHGEEELAYISEDVALVGINNRDLRTFKVDIEHSIRMAESIGEAALKIAESGISDPAVVGRLRDRGFDGFLIGEHFMRTEDPGAACRDFIKKIPARQ